jgi:superoxide dismutase, Cu-Zn family
MNGKLQRRRWLRAALAAMALAALAISSPLPAQQPGGGGRQGGRPGGGGGGRSGAGGASALAVFQAAPDGPQIEGTVLFFARGGQVQVVADVSGAAKPGLYALHVHAGGECVAGPAAPAAPAAPVVVHFASAGGDFNPAGSAHGCPDSAHHHAGDLGNIELQADGSGHLELTTLALSLKGTNSVVDKAVILHAAADDCATQPDGNAGARLACGVAKSVDNTERRQPPGRAHLPTGSGPPPD